MRKSNRKKESAATKLFDIFFSHGGEITEEGFFVPHPVDNHGVKGYLAYKSLKQNNPEALIELYAKFMWGEVDSLGAEFVRLI